MTNHKPQLPPCDLDAERCVLASILVDGDALRPSFKACSDANLDAKAFLEPKHQTIYQACQQLITQGISPDELTLSNQLRSTLTLDQAGGLHYINELTSSIFAPSANLRQAIIILQEKHQARQLINLARDISAKAQSGAFKPDELMQSLMAQAKDISTTSAQDSTTVQMPLADLYNIDRHNDPNNLLGNRWICKGGSLLFSAQAGCGKSTLAQLLVRFYDANSGRIEINGRNLEAYPLQELRHRMVYVPQELFLINGTVLDNIALLNTGLDGPTVESRIRSWNLEEFLDKLPQGLDTPVGERGLLLSAGQRQLVALMRAMVLDPDLLILDEATASIDSKTEAMVQRGIESFVQGRNALLIAHRLSTLLHMDRILVFDMGAIVQDGSHQELLAQPGLYQKLWAAQVGGFLPQDEAALN